MVRAAVVGLGIGMAHCAEYLASKEAKLVAVCDRMPERLSRVGGTFEAGSMLVLRDLFAAPILEKRWEELGVRVYSDFEALMEWDKFDLVSLCTPDFLHYEQALAVLRSGKHLMLEKPVALSAADAERLSAAASEMAPRGVRVAVDYEFRVNPAVEQVKALIDGGEIGRIEALSIHHFRTPFKRDKWQQWIQNRRTSGGLIVEETSHWFDLVRFLSGSEISDLHCASTDRILSDFDFEDVAYVNGHLEDGAIFQIEHALAGFDFSFTVAVYGSEGTIWCGLKQSELSVLDGRQSDHIGIVVWGDPNRPAADAQSMRFGTEAGEPETIRRSIEFFVEALASNRPVACTLADGARALEASLLANASAEQNRVLPQRGGIQS